MVSTPKTPQYTLFTSFPFGPDPFITKPLRVHLHLLRRTCNTLVIQLVYCNILANLLSSNNLLVQHSSGAPLKPIVALLLLSHVGSDIVSHQCRFFLCDYTYIHITPRPQVVE